MLGINGDAEPFFQLPAVRVLNIVYGVIYVAYAVYHIYTRYQLAGFKKGAPKKLLILYVIYPVIRVLYAPIAFLMLGLPISALITPKTIGSVIGGAIGVGIVYILNKIYYDKREELFIN